MKRILSLLAGILLASNAFAGGYVGDYAPGDTIDCNFGTTRPSTMASFTLAGTPAISAYKDNSTTQSTTGITLSADFDGVTGLNHVRVTTGSDGTFYSAGSFHELIITTGTVDSISVTGQPVCSFTLGKVAALRPTVAGRTVDVASTGEVGLDITNVITCTGSIAAWGISDCGTAQAGSTSTTLVLRSAANFTADSRIIGNTCWITGGTGFGESLTVASYVNSTDTATMGGTWPTTPDVTSTYACFGTAPGSAGAVLDELLTNHTTSGSAGERLGRLPNVAAAASGGLPTVDASNAVKVQSGTGSNQISLSAGAVLLQATQSGVTIPTVTTVGTVTNLTNAPTAGDLTATMKTSVGTAVATAQGLVTGTCSSGSTTTCVDAARTEAAASQLQDRLICFSDGWCGMLTTFDPSTDTSTTTKVAPSTRASKTYTIFPSTAL